MEMQYVGPWFDEILHENFILTDCIFIGGCVQDWGSVDKQLKVRQSKQSTDFNWQVVHDMIK